MQDKTTQPWNIKRYERKGDRFHFAFAGQKVATIRFGGGVLIMLGDEFDTSISLQAPFELSQFGQSETYSPHEPVSLAPLLSLIGCRIVKATAADQEALTLAFDNGMTILAPSAPEQYQWEAWEINDRFGFQVMCAIGGDLAIFTPDAEIARRVNRRFA